MGAGLKIYDLFVRASFNSLTVYRKICHLFGAPESKLDRFIALRGDEGRFVTGSLPSDSDRKRVIWFHASSLGEYQIARPVLKMLAEDDSFFIVLTFFSATGMDALSSKGKKETGADLILPLPLDTSAGAKHFIETIRPGLAVFLVSEYWPNFLNVLAEKHIPVILLSALRSVPMSKHSAKDIFLKRMFLYFGTIITHDSLSTNNLLKAGIRNVVELPDPLFDNAIDKRDTEFSDPVIDNFCRGDKDIFVAGSIHTDRDLDIISFFAKNSPDLRLIVVPHEIDRVTLERVMNELPAESCLYSSVSSCSDLSDCRCLVVDKIGILAYIYRYGKGAYVGGGFTRLLHSVIEPFVYGVPVAFGPEIKRKSCPLVMIENGIGTIVRNGPELLEWWERLNDNTSLLKGIKEKSFLISESQKGGAEKISGFIKKILADEKG